MCCILRTLSRELDKFFECHVAVDRYGDDVQDLRACKVLDRDSRAVGFVHCFLLDFSLIKWLS